MRTKKLAFYRPYPKQAEFHSSGKEFRLRLLMAGNQLGKSECGSAEMAMHFTGLYPPAWNGIRVEKPGRYWVGGVTSLTTRDVIQRKLLGPPGEEGTGWIPKESIEKLVPSRGVPGAYDYAMIRHQKGGSSFVGFKSYEQGREKWQADTLDAIWFDEEPPADIWTEGLARCTATGGFTLLTFTPLKGMSDVVRGFYPTPDSAEKKVIRMGIKDAQHISEEMREKILTQYPEHERDARLEGIPKLGSGMIYNVPESMIVEAPIEIPYWWRRIIGIDLGGGDHPTAAVAMAHDTETDEIHVYACYKGKDPRIAIHASAIKTWGQLPVAWPKDAYTRDRNSGTRFADLYREEGIRMLHEHTQFIDGTVSVEPGIAEILNRMVRGKFKVAYQLSDWWDEFKLYHRSNGAIVKKYDDLMDATRYAMMSLRYATIIRQRNRFPATVGVDYDPLAASDEAKLH